MAGPDSSWHSLLGFWVAAVAYTFNYVSYSVPEYVMVRSLAFLELQARAVRDIAGSGCFDSSCQRLERAALRLAANNASMNSM